MVIPQIADLPAMWLRDNCSCSQCRDPRSGQKLFQITDLPRTLAVANFQESPDGTGVEVVWHPDGHESRYSLEWLTDQAPDGGAAAGGSRTEASKTLWQAADLIGHLPQASWKEYTNDPTVKMRFLEAMPRYGFALMREVPCEEGRVHDVIRSFGFVRETNYGTLFEVRVEPDPNNLAFTGAAITPHTDNPYRDPVPTIQLLHCLVNAADGGDSGLVDGFYAAALLRDEDPRAFATLTRIPVPFCFDDTSTALRADRPLISVDPRGRICEVRFNNRSMGTLHLPAEDLAAFYDAYRTFAELLLRPELQLTFRLAPGDCLMFDNTRVMHARTGFAESGARHLQGAYADLDGLESTLTVLRREHAVAGSAVLDDLERLFAGEGAEEYLGEKVTMAQHMLQAGACAEESGAPDHLVAAALLHDIGHFHGVLRGTDLMNGQDNRHSDTGADYLAQWFGSDVTEPVRMHVAAKRYLCAVDPAYVDELSEASVFTLQVQGGPMSAEEVVNFEASPAHSDGVAVRRWDDEAKDPDRPTPSFAHFRPVLARLLQRGVS